MSAVVTPTGAASALLATARTVALRLARHPEASLVIVIAAGFAYGALFVDDVATTGNVTLLLQGIVPQLIVGLGASVALYAGVVDLSIGSVMCVAAMTFALTTHRVDGVALPLAAALAAGIAVGLINSVLVVGFQVESVVATLATLLGIQGAAYVLGGSQSQVSDAFAWDEFVVRQVGPIPILAVVGVVLYGIATLYTKRSRVGRHLLAAGAGPVAASRFGVHVGRLRAGCLLLCGLCAAAGGALSVGLVGSATITLGVQDVFIIYSGILLGGFSITRGGVGSPLGAVLGIAALGLLLNILANAGVAPGWQDIAVGAVLMVSITLDRVRYGAYLPAAAA